jgi:hypothetical protein
VLSVTRDPFLGLPATHFLAAASALLTLPLARRWKLQAIGTLDLSPSMHWPPPVVSATVEHDQGPVLVTIEYRVATRHRTAFLNTLAPLGRERKRDGAYAWGVFEDLARPGVYLETFMLESWLEHLRQHERVITPIVCCRNACTTFSRPRRRSRTSSPPRRHFNQ